MYPRPHATVELSEGASNKQAFLEADFSKFG